MSDLEAVLAAPDSDAPRRVYAEAIRASDPDRAKLIELQLELATIDPPGSLVEQARFIDLFGHASVLLDVHGERFAGEIAARVEAFGFQRGFVEEITLAGDALLGQASELFSLAPIRFVKLSALPVSGLEAVLALPQLEQLVGLDLEGLPIGEEGAAGLAACPKLRGIRWLGLRNTGVRVRGARALAASEVLTELAFVDSEGNAIPLTPSPMVGPDWTITGWNVPGGLKLLEKLYGKKRWFTGIARSMHHHPPRWHQLLDSHASP